MQHNTQQQNLRNATIWLKRENVVMIVPLFISSELN